MLQWFIRRTDVNLFVRFTPEVLGMTASSALVITLIEVLLIKFGCYILNIASDVVFLDIVAYAGYKYVGCVHLVS